MKSSLNRSIARWAGLLALLPAGAALAQTAVVTSLHDQYLPEDPIVISFSGGPGNKLDWIGVYPDGVVPGSVGSTIWNYVDGTKTGATGYTEGSVLFNTGLAFGGTWKAFLLKNDGYEVLGETAFTVLEVGSPLVHVDRRTYLPGETIAVTFTNGPANAKDWIGIYPAGETPDGTPPATIWNYVDGTQSGATGLAAGTVSFAAGLSAPGNYVAFLLRDDGYEIISSESFTVVAPTTVKPRVLSVSPANNSSNLPPVVAFRASITNGTSKVVPASVTLVVDGLTVTGTTAVANDLVSVAYTNAALYAANSAHTYKLTFADNATPANAFVSEGSFTVGDWTDVVLPAPLFFESFDATAEGELPGGWTTKSYSTVDNPEFDLGDLNSASFADWVVLDVDRFNGSFVTYSNPDNPDSWETDYRRVLTANPFNVLNGQVVKGPLASGRMIFSTSGYRNGAAQVTYLYSPDFNLTGKTDVHLSFHSLWEQNQDSIAATEYSVDGGATWLPALYLLHTADIVRDEAGAVDAVGTLTTEHGDVARYTDDSGNEVGGTYGAFIGTPVGAELAPFIVGQPDDGMVAGKRIEKIRLPRADNQAKVRLRFAHAGTDSWYWGLDNVGLYSISAVVTPPVVTISRTGDSITVSWTGAGTLKSSASLSVPNWQPVAGVTGSSVTLPLSAEALFFRVSP
jgi:hypothetical protein